MIEILQPARPGAPSSPIQIDEHGIFQFYYADYQQARNGTRIDWSGGVQYTPETAESLVSRLLNLLHLVKLTIPPVVSPAESGFPIWINVAMIKGLRPHGNNTDILVSKAWFVVEEDIDTVEAAIHKPGPAPMVAMMTVAFEEEGQEFKFEAPVSLGKKAPVSKKKTPAAKKKAPVPKKKPRQKKATKKKPAAKASKKAPARKTKKTKARKR